VWLCLASSSLAIRIAKKSPVQPGFFYEQTRLEIKALADFLGDIANMLQQINQPR
jgi:hypothetical protein